ncbi:MAG: RNA polymerase sigma factor [Nitriliruptorales bacterium]|nr:RNA polymerase sigma factor [Nitriliruptorales bacterium]
MTIGPEFDDVLAAARAGGEWAWTRIYNDLSGPLLGYLRGHGAEDPEGLVGEVFLRITRSLESFEGDEDGFRSWVFTIAHHRLIDERRKRSRRQTTPIDDVRPGNDLPPVEAEPEALDHLTTEEIRALFDAVLTEDQRDVLLLRLVGGLTIAEVAEIVDRTENATKALQRRGLRSLERHFERNPDDPYPYSPPERLQE